MDETKILDMLLIQTRSIELLQNQVDNLTKNQKKITAILEHITK